MPYTEPPKAEPIVQPQVHAPDGKVDFDFVTFNPFATIPVSVYRQIEIQLKEKVWFVPTEFGKGLNYIC